MENLSDQMFNVATFSLIENLIAQLNKYFTSFLFSTIKSLISSLYTLFSIFLVKVGKNYKEHSKQHEFQIVTGSGSVELLWTQENEWEISNE